MSSKDNTDRNQGQALGWMAGFMFVQAVTRAFHFLLNFLLLRLLSPDDLGRAGLQLPFVTMAITRISKEAFHRAAVRDLGEGDVYKSWSNCTYSCVKMYFWTFF